MYSPKFTELAAVSVRRLAWAMGTDMVKTMDIMAQLLSKFFDSKKVCALCQDKSKCSSCAFHESCETPKKALALLY